MLSPSKSLLGSLLVKKNYKKLLFCLREVEELRWEQEQLQQKYAEATRQRDEIQVYLQFHTNFSRVVLSITLPPLLQDEFDVLAG